MNKIRLVRSTIAAVLVSLNLTSCANTHDCYIEGNHIHFFEDDEIGLVRLLDSEKRYTKGYKKTEYYCYETVESSAVCDNELYSVTDNIDYIEREISSAVPHVEELEKRLRYCKYYGYGYGFHCDNLGEKEYIYCYGPQKGLNNTYQWELIDGDFADNAIRNVSYKFRLYKVDEYGNVNSMVFDNIEDAPREYKYFKPNDFKVICYSDQYYMDAYVK